MGSSWETPSYGRAHRKEEPVNVKGASAPVSRTPESGVSIIMDSGGDDG